VWWEGKLSYTHVAEFQTRGLLHYHVIVKGHVTERSVALVVIGGIDLRKAKDIKDENEENQRIADKTGIPFRKSRRRSMSKVVVHAGWSWGPQFDVQHVLPGGKFGVGAYLVKLVGYAVKGTDTSANGPVSYRAKMQSAADRTCTCDKCSRFASASHEGWLLSIRFIRPILPTQPTGVQRLGISGARTGVLTQLGDDFPRCSCQAQELRYCSHQ
jgi:hypothetical protein